MSFLNDTNFSGSRRYEAEPASQSTTAFYRLRAGLILAWARQRIGKIFLLIAPPTKTSAPARRGFTVLGGKQQPVAARRPITDVFPIPTSADRPRTMRNHNQSRL